MISYSQYRKAQEIVNRGDIAYMSASPTRGFVVYRRDTDTLAVVRRTKSNPNRFVSNDQWFQQTGRESTYIAAVKLHLGLTPTIDPESVPTFN